MPRSNYEERIQDLRQAEFGSKLEPLVRLGVMIAVCLVLILGTGDRYVLIWTLVYPLFEGLFAWAVFRAESLAPRWRYRMALLCYTLSGGTFLSLPVYFVATSDSPALIFAGCAGITGLFLYTLQRASLEVGLSISDGIQALILTGALITALWPRLEGWDQQVLVLTVAAATLGYYVFNLMEGIRQQRVLTEARQRYAAAQKARALGQFVGGVAHDFNNQLTAIMGNLELFELLDDPDERALALRQCREASSRAAMTVRQLLASSGRQRLTPTDLDMGQFLRSLGDMLEDVLDAGVKPDIKISAPGLNARVDADMLETCVIQLCLNAQDAMKGKGRIHIRAELCDMPPKMDQNPESAPPYVALHIDDNGPGVSREELDLLAEPFYTTKPASEGSGLGLSAVSGFARQSRGALWLGHAPGGGLRAVILLPSSPDNAQTRSVPINAAETQPQLSGS